MHLFPRRNRLVMAKTCASSSNRALHPEASEQSMQHLCKQVIRSFKIEGGVHDLLQRQPIKNGEQESRQECWIERRTLRTLCLLHVLEDLCHDRANLVASLCQSFSHLRLDEGIVQAK